MYIAQFLIVLSVFNIVQEILELWAIHLLLPSLVKKLAYLGSPDMMALLEIPGIKQVRTIPYEDLLCYPKLHV